MKDFIVKNVDDTMEIEGIIQELIRCKDCKYNKNNEWVDCLITEFFGRTLDNYCSLAERREE